MADITSLVTVLSNYRTTQVSGHQGLLSKLAIDGQTYDIKDPAVEQLASEIQTRLNDLETHTWTAVSKGAGEGKFATAVEQATDGSISVTYGSFTGLADTAVAGQFVTEVDQDANGEITVQRAGVDDSQVTLSQATLTALGLSGTQSVANALDTLKGGQDDIIGTNADTASDNTIYGAKAYADQAVAALAGQDWEDNAKKVQEIIAELEDSEHGNQWLTVLDKLAGMTIANKTATAADAIEYNENLEGAVKAGHALTAAQATAVNTALSKSYAEGDTISSADAAAYNATLTGHIAAGDTFTDTTPTVKEYVDAKVAAAESAASGGITDLDMIVYGADGAQGATGETATTNYASDTTHKVVIKLTEVDGKVTAVDVKTNDVASASDLSTLDGAAVKSVNSVNPTNGAVTLTGANIAVSGSDATLVSTALGNLDTNKANKAAMTTSTIKDWAASYSNETLTWTSTSTSVYVPVNGQTL